MKLILTIILGVFLAQSIFSQAASVSLVGGQSTTIPLHTVGIIYDAGDLSDILTKDGRRLLSTFSSDTLLTLFGQGIVDFELQNGTTILVPSDNIVRVDRISGSLSSLVAKVPDQRRFILADSYADASERLILSHSGAYGAIYINVSDPDTLVFVDTVNVAQKLSKADVSETTGFEYSDGVLTYIGPGSRKFVVNTSFSVSFSENTNQVRSFIYKNDEAVPGAEFRRMMITAGQVYTGSHTFVVDLETDDYIEVFFDPGSHTGSDNLIIHAGAINVTQLK